MSNSLVSIIVPVKNRAELLRTTLQNLCRQTYENLEIIVVDDNSDENINQVIADVGDQRIRLLENKGYGPGAARNTGFLSARGDYVKYFDSDDLMTSNLIESQIQVFDKGNFDVVLSPYVKVKWESGSLLQLDEVMHYRIWSKSKQLSRLMLQGFFVAIPAFLFKKSFVEKTPSWPANFTTYEDWKFLWNMAKQSPKIGHTNKACFFYLLHGEQSTGENLTNSERDLEKSKLMLPLLQEEFNNPTASFKNKLKVGARLYEEVHGLENELLLSQYDKMLHSPKLKIFSLLWRTYQKLTSITSKSKWPIHYGAEPNPVIFAKYLNNLR